MESIQFYIKAAMGFEILIGVIQGDGDKKAYTCCHHNSYSCVYTYHTKYRRNFKSVCVSTS